MALATSLRPELVPLSIQYVSATARRELRSAIKNRRDAVLPLDGKWRRKRACRPLATA